jgi:hypothetical protein
MVPTHQEYFEKFAKRKEGFVAKVSGDQNIKKYNICRKM